MSYARIGWTPDNGWCGIVSNGKTAGSGANFESADEIAAYMRDWMPALGLPADMPIDGYPEESI